MSFARWLAARREYAAGWRADRRLRLATRTRAARVARQAFYLGDGVTMTRALGRYIIHLPTRDRSLTPSLLFNGRWEPWVTRVIADHVRPGMTVADVGANVGYFTLLMADRVGPAGRVHAFEPNDELAGLLDRSVDANGFGDRVTLHPCPLGAEDGLHAVLLLASDALGGGAIWPDQDGLGGTTKPVTVRRLDAIDGADRIELLKIDAEGYEPEIWTGMAGLLASRVLRTIVMEFTAFHYDDPAGFLDRIAAAGFRLEKIERRGGVVPTTAADILAWPVTEDQVLLLTR